MLLKLELIACCWERNDHVAFVVFYKRTDHVSQVRADLLILHGLLKTYDHVVKAKADLGLRGKG